MQDDINLYVTLDRLDRPTRTSIYRYFHFWRAKCNCWFTFWELDFGRKDVTSTLIKKSTKYDWYQYRKQIKCIKRNLTFLIQIIIKISHQDLHHHHPHHHLNKKIFFQPSFPPPQISKQNFFGPAPRITLAPSAPLLARNDDYFLTNTKFGEIDI